MKRALNIRMKIDGPESGTVAFLLVRLANVATAQKDYSDAEQFYRKALAIQEKTSGASGSEIVLSTLSDLAKLYSFQRDYVQTESIYEQVLAAQMKLKPGSGQILGTVEQLGPIYEADGKFGQAEVLYQKAVEVNQTALPQGHLSLIGSLNDLALYYERRERLSEARTYYKLALDEFGNPPSSDKSLMDLNRAIVLKNYARLLRKMNRADEATGYETQAKTLDEGLTPKPLVKK
jgi:tetratricopeptide (TPR) repeat protein